MMNLTIKCHDGQHKCRIETIEQCCEFGRRLFSDTCRCTATLYMVDVDYEAVVLSISILENVIAIEGRIELEEELIVLVAPVLEMLGIKCEKRCDSNNNSVIDPVSGTQQEDVELLGRHKQHRCNQCGKEFPEKKMLKSHIRKKKLCKVRLRLKIQINVFILDVLLSVVSTICNFMTSLSDPVVVILAIKLCFLQLHLFNSEGI